MEADNITDDEFGSSPFKGEETGQLFQGKDNLSSPENFAKIHSILEHAFNAQQDLEDSDVG